MLLLIALYDDANYFYLVFLPLPVASAAAILLSINVCRLLLMRMSTVWFNLIHFFNAKLAQYPEFACAFSSVIFVPTAKSFSVSIDTNNHIIFLF